MQTISRHGLTNHLVQLFITKDGSGVGGQSPTIEVRRLSDGLYLDHSAVAAPFWISTGGQQTETMSTVSWQTGLYTYNFIPVNVNITDDDAFDFIVRNSLPYKLVDIEHVIYEDIKDELDLILDMVSKSLKTKKNRLKIDKVANTLTYYDDDQTTPLFVFDLFDNNGLPNWKNILERIPV